MARKMFAKGAPTVAKKPPVSAPKAPIPTKSNKPPVKKEYPPKMTKPEDRTRTTKTTIVTDPGKKGRTKVELGTVQRKPTGGVEFVPKSKQDSIENKKGQIVDPKSKKVEDPNKAKLRSSAEGDRIPANKKPGDYLTYKTKKGKEEVYGRITKEPDTAPQTKDVVTKEYKTEKIYQTGKTGGKMMGNTYVGGRYTVTPKKSKYTPENELKSGKTQAGGYVVENEKKQKELVKKAGKVKAYGAKKMKLNKKC